MIRTYSDAAVQRVVVRAVGLQAGGGTVFITRMGFWGQKVRGCCTLHAGLLSACGCAEGDWSDGVYSECGGYHASCKGWVGCREVSREHTGQDGYGGFAKAQAWSEGGMVEDLVGRVKARRRDDPAMCSWGQLTAADP